MEIFLTTALILLTATIISILIAYFAAPIQLLKRITYLNRLKLFNCPYCLTPYVTFALLFYFGSFPIFPMIGISVCNILLTALIIKTKLLEKEIDLFV